MAGMNCDHCGKLLQYKTEVVAIYEEGGVRKAQLVIEDSPGIGDADGLEATSKYHRECYEDARQADPSLPPLPASD